MMMNRYEEMMFLMVFFLFGMTFLLIVVWLIKSDWKNSGGTDSEKPKTTMVKVDSSAYCDKGRSASGRALKSGYSLAGRVSWLGKTVKVYECKSNGSVGALKGTYRFDDTGYGKSTGSGASRILKGKSIGTIENGTCVDFFMNTRSECINWGRRPVYIEFVN